MNDYSNKGKDEAISLAKSIKRLEFVENIIKECAYFFKDKQEYSKMSLKELSAFYDRVEEGLIQFNLAYKDFSRCLSDTKEKEEPEQSDIVLRTLEAQLLSIVSTMSTKNPNNLDIQKRLKESPWGIKLKDKDYYIKISSLVFAGIDWKVDFYNFLQEE